MKRINISYINKDHPLNLDWSIERKVIRESRISPMAVIHMGGEVSDFRVDMMLFYLSDRDEFHVVSL